MQKPVKSVIAAARVMMRRPSEAKLATEDMRFFLHQILEELHTYCIKENADFFTHEFPIELTYDADMLGYTFSIGDQTRTEDDAEVVAVNTSNLIPVFMSYQGLTDDPDKDRWYRVRIAKLSAFPSNAAPGEVTAAMLGNVWQGLNSPHFKLNADEDFVSNHTWRISCRIFPSDEMDYDDTVPFPGEHTALIEHMLAVRCLPIVRDDSPSWKTFYAGQMSLLLLKEKQLMSLLLDWINKDVENMIITNQGYHYRYNNKQLGRRERRYRAEW